MFACTRANQDGASAGPLDATLYDNGALERAHCLQGCVCVCHFFWVTSPPARSPNPTNPTDAANLTDPTNPTNAISATNATIVFMPCCRAPCIKPASPWHCSCRSTAALRIPARCVASSLTYPSPVGCQFARAGCAVQPASTAAAATAMTMTMTMTGCWLDVVLVRGGAITSKVSVSPPVHHIYPLFSAHPKPTACP